MFHRNLPYTVTAKFLDSFTYRNYRMTDQRERECAVNFLCQVFRRDGTFEYALGILFTSGLRAKLGLAGPLRLANPEFTVPFSFVYGDVDWVASICKEDAIKLIEERKAACETEEMKAHYNVLTLPDSDHNM